MTENQPPIDVSVLRRETVPGGPTVEKFLRDVQNPTEGWSEPYGGPDGVIAAAGVAQEAVTELSSLIAAVRTAAIREQLCVESGIALSRRLGISTQAISQAARSARHWKDETW